MPPVKVRAAVAVLMLGIIALTASCTVVKPRPVDQLERLVADSVRAEGEPVATLLIEPNRLWLSFVTDDKRVMTRELFPADQVQQPDTSLGSNLPTLPSDRLDLAGVERRAKEFVAGCGDTPYQVWVRAASGVSIVTGSTCGDQRVGRLNDLELPVIDDPWTAAGLTTLWRELAELGEPVRVQYIVLRNDSFEVRLDNSQSTRRDCAYVWRRNLKDPSESRTICRDRGVTLELDLAVVTPERLAAAIAQARQQGALASRNDETVVIADEGKGPMLTAGRGLTTQVIRL